jgi:hypothetical protein
VRSRGVQVMWCRPIVTWCAGHVVCRSRGVQVTWCAGHVVCRSRGVQVTWCAGHVVCGHVVYSHVMYQRRWIPVSACTLLWHSLEASHPPHRARNVCHEIVVLMPRGRCGFLADRCFVIIETLPGYLWLLRLWRWRENCYLDLPSAAFS